MKRLSQLAAFAYALSLTAVSITTHASTISSAADPVFTGANLIDFDSIAAGNYGSLTTGGITFSNGAAAITPAIQGISVRDNGGDHYLRYSTSIFPNPEGIASSVPLVALRINFDAPISAFGLSVSGSYPYSLKAYDSANNLLETFGPSASSYYNYFMGIAASNISYAILGNMNGFDYLEIDDLILTPAKAPNAVPLPAALPLMLSGLTGLGLIKRKKI